MEAEMSALLMPALLTSIDTLIVSAAIGLAATAPLQRLRLAVLFGVCGAGAILAGANLGVSVPLRGGIAGMLVLAYGIAILLLGLIAPRTHTALALPFLSLDNLAAGARARRWLRVSDSCLAGAALAACSLVLLVG